VAKRECTRCHGLMVERPCWQRDWRDVSGRWPRGLYMWCCANCGHRSDSTIEANRAWQCQAMPPSRHERIWRQVQDAVAAQEVA
jgi:hypothetical protein